MKVLNGKTGLSFRLGTMIAALLLGQQAMAIGTVAGTPIDNTVTVDYDVNGIDQDDLTDTVSFVVDRRVDFDLALVGGALVPVAPGESDAFFDFLLTNDSNSPLDFTIDLAQMVGGLVRGVTDDGTMAAVDYAVNSVSEANQPGTPVDPARNGAQFVDELAADDSIRIRVFGDAALAMLNGEIAGVQLDATAGEPGTGGSEGAALVDTTDTDAGIDNVFAEDGTGGDGIQTNFDGWTVVSADLTVTKSYSVIDGDLGTGQPIPGATVQYVITIVNSSTTPADAVAIDDVIDDNITLDLNVAAYGGNDIDVDLEGATIPCDVEVNGDGDGCDFVAGTRTITIGAADLVPSITIGDNETLTITYQVTIPDPDPTP
ncbi:MAG: hypothetical protein ACR2QI_02725 [Woeseiaceae bacterium]